MPGYEAYRSISHYHLLPPNHAKGNDPYYIKRHTHLHLQNKTVYEIASELNRLHSLGLAGQLTPADIVGGTFSLSNIGAVS